MSRATASAKPRQASTRTAATVAVDLETLTAQEAQIIASRDDVLARRDDLEAAYRGALLARAQGDAAAGARVTEIDNELQETFRIERDVLLTLHAIAERRTALAAEHAVLLDEEQAAVTEKKRAKALAAARQVDALVRDQLVPALRGLHEIFSDLNSRQRGRDVTKQLLDSLAGHLVHGHVPGAIFDSELRRLMLDVHRHMTLEAWVDYNAARGAKA